MSIINRFLREPLLHFFLLGALLFLLYGWLDRDSRRAPDEIVVDEARINSLTATFAKTWSRAPTAEDLQALIDAWVREEVLYREGIAIGFDRNDPIIRRRVAQKMTFVSDGVAPEIPDDQELQAWLDSHADDYAIPGRYTLSQVYFDPQQHGDNIESVLASAKEILDSGDQEERPGDATMLPGEFVDVSETEIRRTLGQQFADGLTELQSGEWQGPVVSGYGLHFVRIAEHVPGRKPSLDEVRRAVERDVLNNLSDDIDDAFYQALRDRYTVRVENSAQNARQ